jgi:hypothetical protein
MVIKSRKSKLFPLILVLVSLIMVFSCSGFFSSPDDSPENQDTENTDTKNDGNDKKSSATLYTLGEIQSFKIDYRYDIDYFKFNVEKPGLFFVNLNEISNSILPKTSIFDIESTLITYSTVYEWTDAWSFGLQLKSGEYYISIENTNYEHSSQAMTFSITQDQIDTFEINSTMENAKKINLGVLYRANIFPKNDVDIYSFDVDSNSIIRFQLDSVSSKFNIFFYILDAEGTAITDGVLSQIEVSSDNPLDYGHALNKGSYFVKLKSTDYNSSTKPYRLLLFKDTTDQTEWNNSTSFAYPIKFGVPAMAAIYPANDVDYFTFTLDEADTVQINVDSISSILTNFTMKLYDRDLAEKGNVYNPVNGSLKYKKYLPAGTYYFKTFEQYSPFSYRRYRINVNKSNKQ